VAPTEQQIRGRIDPQVAKDLLRRGLKVESRAKRLISGATGHPKRVDTGHLRSSIRTQLRSVHPITVVRVGTNVRYARWVHDGTGLYGPRRRLIRPRRGKVLVFTPRGSTQQVFTRYVRGMRRNEFLRDALSAAKG
jgi:hypothetical protein